MSSEPPKKRGRRKNVVANTEEEPTKKGKKIQEIKLQSLQNILQQSLQSSKSKRHIILELNCFMSDVDTYLQNKIFQSDHSVYKPDVPQEIQPFESNNKNYDTFESDDKNTTVQQPRTKEEKENISNEDLKSKIRELKLTFYKKEQVKKSACFWCTYDFDTETCFVIEQSTKGGYLGNGSFCSPECSVAYLFNNMKMDDSAKIESYQLINYYYSTDGTNIKPAACPFYFLEKYYGNMSIQEYRKMCKSNYMLLCVDKPMTRVLPEIHEDNEKTLFNNTPYTQTRGNYKVKRQSEKGSAPNRNSILRDNFGVGS